MGVECTKSKKYDQAQKTNENKLMRSGSLGSLKNNRIFISLMEWNGYENQCIQFENKENFKEYQIQLIYGFNRVKFLPKQGFVDIKYNEISKADEINFRTFKTDTEEVNIQCSSQLLNQQFLWRKVPSSGLLLGLNSQIRLGRFSMKLRYFQNEDQINAMKEGSRQIQVPQVNQSGFTCRVCHKQMIENNPLIIPCGCPGFSRLVHQSCFSREIFDQTVGLHDHKIMFKFVVTKDFCQICKQSYENYIWKRFLSIINIYPGYYSIFQKRLISPVKYLSSNIEYIVMRFTEDNQQVKIGRLPICEFIIPDENISKVHAKLLFKNGNIYVFDNSARIGTFVEMKSKTLSIGSSYLIGKCLVSISSNNTKSIENFIRRPSYQY